VNEGRFMGKTFTAILCSQGGDNSESFTLAFNSALPTRSLKRVRTEGKSARNTYGWEKFYLPSIHTRISGHF
jgi:hypothetical protein